MFSGPVRGGTRGGQGDFKWTDVATDKDRENYLGHSILAPVGRWQKNKDVTWYNKDGGPGDEERERERLEELRKVKEAETEALHLALGYTPANPNDTPLGGASTSAGPSKPDPELRAQEKAARRALKDQKRREKEERRERRRERRGGRSRSRSPERKGGRSRSRSPEREREREREYRRDDRGKERDRGHASGSGRERDRRGDRNER